MSARPSDLATDTRWWPSRTKYRSPILYSDTGGSASPRRCAALMRSQRLRSRAEVGRSPRSKSTVRSTLPTIFSSGTTCSPRSCWPVRPSASTTSSNGSISATSSGSRRSLRPMSASRRARRAREKSDWASEPGKPVLTLRGASSAGADGVAVERVVQRANQREDAVETGDPERLHDGVIVADDHERAAPQLQPAMRPDQHSEARGVDERRAAEIHDHVRAAGVDRRRYALLELGGREQVDLAGDGDDVPVAVELTVRDRELDGHEPYVMPGPRRIESSPVGVREADVQVLRLAVRRHGELVRELLDHVADARHRGVHDQGLAAA